MAQLVVAALVAAIVTWLAGGAGRPSGFLAWVLVALALLQLPFAAFTATRLGAVTTRQMALSRTLLTAIFLAATAWFAALALATGQRGLSVYVLFALVMLSYALGFLAVSRLAARAAQLPAQAAAPGPTAAVTATGSTVEAGVLEDVDHVEGLGGP